MDETARNGSVSLLRADLIRYEHALAETVGRFVAFAAHSLYFPQSSAELAQGFDPAVDEPLYLQAEKRLLLPLRMDGALYGVFIADGVRLRAPKTVPRLLGHVGELCLRNLLLFKQSISDPVSGLWNEHGFMAALRREIEMVQACILPEADPASELDADCPPTGRFALIRLDLDGFGLVIDDIGFLAGDKVLARAGEIIHRIIPEHGAACRLGKDEFAVLLPGASPQAAADLACELRREIAKAGLGADTVNGGLTASVGWVLYPSDLQGQQLRRPPAEQARTLLIRARHALDAAKENGRNQVYAFKDIIEHGGRVLEKLPLDRLRISLGRGVDVQEGQLFLVWPSGFGQRAEADHEDDKYPSMHKGELIVMETFADSALAEILRRSDSSWEIGPGDRLTLVRDGKGLPETDAETRTALPDDRTGLYAYRDFLGRWVGQVESAERFALVLVKIMDRSGKKLHEMLEHMEEQVARVAEAARPIVGEEAMGGRYSLNSMIFYVPGRQAEELKSAFEDFCDAAFEHYGSMLAVGLSGYPCLDFKRTDALENGRKALDHALLLPPPMVAAFDSVSLNISADRRFSRGDVYGAVEEYKLALLADEHNQLARNSLGICYARMGRLEQALSLFETVLAAEPDNIMTLYNYGHVCMRLGRKDDARAAFRRCLELDPQHLFSLIRLGQLAEREGEMTCAQEFYSRAGGLKGGEAMVMRHLARLAVRQGQRDKGREYLHQAILHNPKDESSIHLLATIYLDQGGDPEIAETLARQSAALNPENTVFWETLARALDAGGKADEAKAARDKAVGLRRS